MPRLTAGGKWLIYRVRPKQGERDRTIRFYRVPADGGKPEQLLTSTAAASLRCDFGGPCIVMETIGPDKIISEVDVTKGKGRELFRFAAPGPPARSPDGIWVYVAGPGRIQILDTAERPKRMVSVKGGMILQSIEWAADSSGWFVASQEGSTLYFVDLSGRTKTIYTQPPASLLWSVPSPDGKYLAIMSSTFESNLWSITSF